MGMFDNFTETSGCCCSSCPTPPPKCPEVIERKPYEDYNTKGDFLGYWWNYGDAVNLQFDLTGEITVGSDDIIYYTRGFSPQADTVGLINGKFIRAFNVVDEASWKCVGYDGSTYTWVEDDEFTAPENGERNIYFTVADYIKDKTLIFELYNFRNESILKRDYFGSSDISIPIDYELSKTLKRGVYRCSLTVFGDNGLNSVIISPNDFVITIK